MCFFKGLATNVQKSSKYFEDASFISKNGKGVRMKKGQHFGDFNLGSTMVLLFEAPPSFRFSTVSHQKVKYGKGIGSCLPAKQKRKKWVGFLGDCRLLSVLLISCLKIKKFNFEQITIMLINVLTRVVCKYFIILFSTKVICFWVFCNSDYYNLKIFQVAIFNHVVWKYFMVLFSTRVVPIYFNFFFDQGCAHIFQYSIFNQGCAHIFQYSIFNQGCAHIFQYSIFNQGCPHIFQYSIFNQDSMFLRIHTLDYHTIIEIFLVPVLFLTKVL